MRRLGSLGVGVLCLAMVGCASTPRRMTVGPGGEPGPVAHVHSPAGCGCGPVRPSMASLSLPAPPMPSPDVATALIAESPAMATAPGSGPTAAATDPSPWVATRFFPMFHEGDWVPVDVLETSRPDLLGVRTTLRGPGQGQGQTPGLGASAPQDTRMRRTSVDEEPTPVVEVAVAEGAPAAPEAPAGAAAGGGPPARGHGDAIALEQLDDPSLAGRPRLSQDGTLIDPRRRDGDPTRYGPDPTYPASYYDEGAAPTSVPKTREVWPTRGPSRPGLLTRVLQRFRGKTGVAIANAPQAVPPAPSARSKPGHLAERREVVERVAADRLDEPSQR